MPTATVTSRGQTVIPKPVRDLLGLHPGDMVDFVIHDQNTIVLKPATLDVRQLKGALYKPGRKAVALAGIRRVIARRGGRLS